MGALWHHFCTPLNKKDTKDLPILAKTFIFLSTYPNYLYLNIYNSYHLTIYLDYKLPDPDETLYHMASLEEQKYDQVIFLFEYKNF